MTTALYILLGVLVVGVVAMQLWIARTSELAGERAGTVRFVRLLNVVLLVVAVILAVYALGRG